MYGLNYTSRKKCYKNNEFKFTYIINYCISPNVGRYFGLVTGPPPAMEAIEAAATEAEATERFRCERSSVANLTRINLIF